MVKITSSGLKKQLLIPFGSTSLIEMLQTSGYYEDKEVLKTPLWYNNIFQLINDNHNINMNLLEHDHSLKIKIKEFLHIQDKPDTTILYPRNISINILLNIGIK